MINEDVKKDSFLRKNKKIILSSLLFLLILVGAVFFLTNNNISVLTPDGGVVKTDNNVQDYKKIVYIGFAKKDQPFWLSMGNFIEAAAAVRKIFYVDSTPDNGSAEDQINSLKTALNQHVDGIILGAYLPSTLMEILDNIHKANIPVVAIDTLVDSPAVVGFIATNNLESANLAGDYIVSATKGRGKVLILCGEKDHPNSIARETGVREKVEKAKMSTIVRYTDWKIEKAYQFAKEELSKNKDVSAIFGCFDPGLISAEKAVEELGLQGKIVMVGFDGLQDTFQMIQEGKIAATVAQPIKQMAREGVETIISYLEKKPTVKEKLIRGILVTKSNVGYFKD